MIWEIGPIHILRPKEFRTAELNDLTMSLRQRASAIFPHAEEKHGV